MIVKVSMVKWMLREEAQALTKIPLIGGVDIFTKCVTADGVMVILEGPVNREEPFEILISQ